MDIMKEMKELKDEVYAIGGAPDKVATLHHIDRIIEHMRRADIIKVPECFKIKKEGIE